MDWFTLAFASALFSAGAALSQKKILFKLEALDFSFYLSIISLIFSIPFFINMFSEFPTAESLLILYIKSILGTFAFLCVMLVLKNFEISKALPLMVLTPGLVAVFAFLFLGDSLSTKETFGIILLMIGTYVLEVSDSRNFISSLRTLIKSKSHYYVLSALLLFTASAILDRLLLTGYKLSPENFMAGQQLFFAFNFFILFVIKKKRTDGNGSYDQKIWYWIILIAILTIGYRYTQIEATKLAPVALVLAVKRISVFFSSLIGGKLFKEKDLIKKGIAAAIMIAGTLFLLDY
jgi:drug/metabolite transporter (DMT)-like permease